MDRSQEARRFSSQIRQSEQDRFEMLVKTNEIVYHGGLDDDTATVYEYLGMLPALTLKLSIQHFEEQDYQCEAMHLDEYIDASEERDANADDLGHGVTVGPIGLPLTVTSPSISVHVKETGYEYPYSGAKLLKVSPVVPRKRQSL